VHESQQCPLCASETFVFLTRWVPAPERRQKPRSSPPPPSPDVDTYRELLSPEEDSAGWRFVKRGAMGLALFGVASLVFRNREARTDEPDHSGPSSGAESDDAKRSDDS
jgi:hypothetical protein